MSNIQYELKLKEALNDLMDNYQMEFLPYEDAKTANKLKAKKKPKEWFDFYAQLYIRYLETYKKLEDTYDQLMHPQKRNALFPILKKTLGRVLEIKDDLVMFNTHTKAVNSKFVNMDELFFDLKILPEKLEIPIPRYAKELDHKNIVVRDQFVEKFIKQFTDQTLPEEEELVYRDFEKLTEETAMHCILTNERGRQGIQRALAMKEEKKNTKGKRRQAAANTDKTEYAVVVQKYFRAFLDRKIIYEARKSEMEFLGMSPDCEVELEMLIHQSERNRLNRKDDQQRNIDLLKDQTYEIKENLKKTESPDIKEHMLYERRTWITEFYENHEGKELPFDVMEFYERNDVALPLSPEEEDLKKKEAAEAKKNAEKAKKNAGKKKKTEKEEFLDTHVPKGPQNSEYVMELQSTMEGYNYSWGNKEEPEGTDKKYDRALIVDTVMPEIERTIETEVDEIIKCELQNLYLKLAIKKKKKKNKKAKRVKPERKPVIPGAKQVGKRQPLDLMGDCAKFGVLKRLVPAKMTDFLGEHNLIRTIQEAQAEGQIDPSLAQLRNTVAEQIGVRLGGGFFQPGKDRTYLFYGPQGTGKSLMVRALANECNAMVLDLSPYVVADNFTEKKRITELMYIAFKVAKEYQPAIIVIDEIEHFFPSKAAKKKTKKGILAGKCQKFKKDLMGQVKKHLDPSDKVVLICCTNRPNLLSVPEVKKLFNEKFYFPYPDYNARQYLFKHLVKQHNITLSEFFPIEQLASMTKGFTAGSVSLKTFLIISFFLIF